MKAEWVVMWYILLWAAYEIIRYSLRWTYLKVKGMFSNAKSNNGNNISTDGSSSGD